MKTSLAILACFALIPVHAQEFQRPLYPIVVHLGHELLDPAEKRTYRKVSEVRQVVLGTAAVGTSETVGTATVAMTPAKDDAKFLVSFQGVVKTTTVGRNRSALIYSRTTTPFRCTCEIAFDYERGFVASTPLVSCQTQLEYDGFGSTRRGILGRVVRRVAARRADESHEQARQIAERENRTALAREFQTAIEARLADANRRTKTLQVFRGLFAPMQKMKVKAVTSEDCLHLAIYDEEDFPDSTRLPTNRLSKDAVEIWIHSTTFGRNGDIALGLLEAGTQLEKVGEAIPFLASLRPTKADAWSLKASNQWMVISLPSPAIQAKPGSSR